jgi:hypothetical protein
MSAPQLASRLDFRLVSAFMERPISLSLVPINKEMISDIPA